MIEPVLFILELFLLYLLHIEWFTEITEAHYLETVSQSYQV